MIERSGPESTPGAEPGDDAVPEHSHGGVLDDPQPSAPRKQDVDVDMDKADTRVPSEEDV